MSERPWRLAVLAPFPAPVIDGILAGLPVEVLPCEPGAAGLDAVADAELIVHDFRMACPGIDAGVVARAPHLAFVQQPGVGVQTHDLDALAAAGIPLANTAGFNAVTVAEWVIGAMIALARQFRWMDDEMRDGRWPELAALQRGVHDVAGRRVGIVGFGHVALALVPRLQALGCEVSYWTRRRRPPEEEAQVGATWKELDDLVATSDVLVNVIALGPTTRGLLSAERVARLPEGALVLDAARGGILDQRAVVDAVDAGRLGGAALDVYETEPLPVDSPLRGHDRVLLTPHLAGLSRGAFARVTGMVRANLARATTGEPLADVVNGADPVVRRRG